MCAIYSGVAVLGRTLFSDLKEKSNLNWIIADIESTTLCIQLIACQCIRYYCASYSHPFKLWVIEIEHTQKMHTEKLLKKEILPSFH